jgi:amidase
MASPDFLAQTKAATQTAPLVQKLLDNGACLTGMTICDEFFYSLTGINAHYGSPVNVRARDRMAGGSSSGSAASVAASLCDFSIGSDTGGSVRVPAAFCGLYGIRPTHGEIDLTGATEMAPSFDTAGWFARDAELLKIIGDVLLPDQACDISDCIFHLASDAFAQATDDVQQSLHSVCDKINTLMPFGNQIENK